MSDAPSLLRLPDGRELAYDDAGRPDGSPVLWLHGVPDSRLSRGPDAVTTEVGVRLIAVDRPGIGRSTAAPGRTLASTADDLVALLDALELASVALLAWSSGAPFAAALAARHPDRVRAIGLTAPVVPIDAYADPAVLEAGGPGRAMFAEMAAIVSPAEVADEMAPYLPIDLADDAEAESVAQGRDGLHAEITIQAAPPDVALAAVRAPATIWAGSADEIAPAAFAHWWASIIPGGSVHVIEGETHDLHRRHWADLLHPVTP